MRNTSKSGLFLIEMIIAIMFFALAAAVCTNLFVQAHLMSENTRKSNMAVLTAQSVAESFKATGGSAAETAGFFQVQDQGGTFRLYYSKDWQRATEGDHAFRVDVAIDDSLSLRTADIVVVDALREDSSLFSLEAKQYTGE